MVTVRTTEWESKSILLTHMTDMGGKNVVLGMDAEAPRKFYSFALQTESGPGEIGLLSSGHGTTPDLIILEAQGSVMVGHDESVTLVDLATMTVSWSRQLNGLFYHFLRLGSSDHVLVVHELGVVRLDERGSVLWMVSTDILTSATLDGHGNLVISDMDTQTPRIISVATGETVTGPA